MGSGELSRLYRSFLACRGGGGVKFPFRAASPSAKKKRKRKRFAAAARETGDLCTTLFVSLRRQLFDFLRVKTSCEIENGLGLGLDLAG